MSLIVENVSHSYGGECALEDVSLTVESGEIVCLFGPSGCGKTTLLRLIAGFEQVQNGRIILDGKLVAEPTRVTAPEERPVGIVFQDFALFPHMSVAKNIAFGLNSFPARHKDRLIEEQLEAVNLMEHAAKYPHQLSGGQQQRIALARAFVRQPLAMLLDEPFASLDITMRRQLRVTVRAMLKRNNAAALLVTHDPEEALALGDKIAVMKDGCIVEIGSPFSLYNNPESPEGALVFPEAQKFEGVVEGGQFQSAFGTFDVEAAGNGRCIAIAHTDALSIREDLNGILTVMDCRYEGPHWRIAIEPSNKDRHDERIELTSDTPVEIGCTVLLNVAAFTKFF